MDEKSTAALSGIERDAEAAGAKLHKLDVYRNAKTAARYGVKDIPAVLVFEGGEVVDRRMGT
jgi:thioredoxin-like negative regulator of GroEL